MAISRPLKSLSGNLTETVYRDGIKMAAALFEKAPGRKMSYPEYLDNAEVFKQLGQITLFDFDECQYSWFVEDIAIQLFASLCGFKAVWSATMLADI